MPCEFLCIYLTQPPEGMTPSGKTALQTACGDGGIIRGHRLSPAPPPWEAVTLVSQFLDPRTLAVASTVCKAWRSIMSSDHLWEPICLSYRPSIYSLGGSSANTYSSLFALSQSSAIGRARRRERPKPALGLGDLIFAVDIFRADGYPLFSLTTPGDELASAAALGGVFRFDVSAAANAGSVGGLVTGTVRVVWTVLTKGLKGAFTVMDANGVGGGPKDLWLSEELPPPACCSSLAPSGLSAEAALTFGGSRVPILSLGLLDAACWGYARVDDALRYLQHFLLPGDKFVCTSNGGTW